MNRGSIDAAAEEIIGRFRKGLAATYSRAPDPAARKGLRVHLIPQRLLGPDNGLLIVVEGKGSLTWDGSERMNPFRLVTAGVRPLAVAEEVCILLHAVVNHMAASIADRKSTEQIKEIEYHGD